MTARKVYWHILHADRKLGYNDGRIVKYNVPIKFIPDFSWKKPETCICGMHASQTAFGCLPFAVFKKETNVLNKWITIVHLDRIVDRDDDKVSAWGRTVKAWVCLSDVIDNVISICKMAAMPHATPEDMKALNKLIDAGNAQGAMAMIMQYRNFWFLTNNKNLEKVLQYILLRSMITGREIGSAVNVNHL